MKRMYKMFQLFLVARVKIKSSLRMAATLLLCYWLRSKARGLWNSTTYLPKDGRPSRPRSRPALWMWSQSATGSDTLPSLPLSPSFLCHLDTRPGQIQATGWLAAWLWFHCYYIGGWHPPHPCPLHCWGRKSLSNILPEEGCKHKDAMASHLGQLPMFKTSDPD